MTVPAGPPPEVTHVRIDTDAEIRPALSIVEIGNPAPGEGFVIPRDLWRKFCAAQEELDVAEAAVMRCVVGRYPEARRVREWLDGQ